MPEVYSFDFGIAHLHLNSFQKSFNEELTHLGKRSRFLTHTIPPGETLKSREGKAAIEGFLLLNKCTCDTVILALGNLVGFVATTLCVLFCSSSPSFVCCACGLTHIGRLIDVGSMCGVRFVQIPTTLLTMVDSSVGGKTAIDMPHGKNLIGAFWQPEYIFINAAFLETLPAREFSNGMAEVVKVRWFTFTFHSFLLKKKKKKKTVAIWNESDFASLELRPAEIVAAIETPSVNYSGRTKATRSVAQELLLSVIMGSISVKAHIVINDERETTGLRNLVNFGHRIGHAIEAMLTPSILHGECISVGMIIEGEVSCQLGHLGQVGIGRLTRCLKSYNLPVSPSDPRIAAVPASRLLGVDRLLDIMRIDKKNSGPEKKVVLLATIGKTVEQKASVVSDPVIGKTLAKSPRLSPESRRRASSACLRPDRRAFPIALLCVGCPQKWHLGYVAIAAITITGTSCTGSASLQGDARFAKEVLEPMGCTVMQTETETTVQGPPIGQFKALGLIDMEPMTDALLTALVVAAVAATSLAKVRELSDGSQATTTRIVGIANQRVKECNRIQAMIDQLGMFTAELSSPCSDLWCIKPSLASKQKNRMMALGCTATL